MSELMPEGDTSNAPVDGSNSPAPHSRAEAEQLVTQGNRFTGFNEGTSGLEGKRITQETFPMPDRADTFARPLSEKDQAALEKRREFGARQAEAANDVLDRLQARDTPPDAQKWAEIYQSLTEWRSGLDAARMGKGITQGQRPYYHAYY